MGSSFQSSDWWLSVLSTSPWCPHREGGRQMPLEIPHPIRIGIIKQIFIDQLIQFIPSFIRNKFLSWQEGYKDDYGSIFVPEKLTI